MQDFLYRVGRWVVAIAFFAVILFLFYRFFPWSAFQFDQLDPRLPDLFHYGDSPTIFWGWVVVLLSVAGLSVARLLVYVRRESAAPMGRAGLVEPVARGRGDDVDQAPAELRLPPGARADDPVFLFLSTSAGRVAELFHAAEIVAGGDVVLVTNPQRAVLVNAASSSLFARGDEGGGGGTELEALCHNLMAPDPEFPALRGVFVVVPFDELAGADLFRWARRLHADLGTIREVMQLEVPTYLLVSRMERAAGFMEFARLRGLHEPRQGRWGVSLLRLGDDGEGDSAWRKLSDFRFQVRRRTIDLLVRDLLDSERNARLIRLDRTVGSIIGALASLIAGTFPTVEKDRAFLRAVDLVATGIKPEEQAYLLSAVYLPIAEDEAATRWTAGAIERDARERRFAARLAVGGSLVSLAIWLYIQLVLESLGVMGWLLLLAVVGGGVAAPLLMWRRWSSAGDATRRG